MGGARRPGLVLLAAAVLSMAVGTRFSAEGTAARMVASDRARMDVTRSGALPQASWFYRDVGELTGHLWAGDAGNGDELLGLATGWAPVVSLLPEGSTVAGFGPSDGPPPRVGPDGETSARYLDWWAARRLVVVVTASDVVRDALDRPLELDWHGRRLPVVLRDVDPETGVAFLVAQLDDGELETEEVDENLVPVVRSGLAVTPTDESPAFVRGAARAHRSTDGFVSVRVGGDEGIADRIRGDVAPEDLGGPVGFLFFADGSQGVIGLVTTTDATSGWTSMAPSSAIDEFARRIAALEADTRPAGYLGVGGHSALLHQAGGAGGESRGMTVEVVAPESPATRAGLQEGDRIVAVADDVVHTKTDFLESIADTTPGDQIVIRFERAGRSLEVAITLSERPK